MKLHNTLTKSTDEFKPINGKTVSLYTCGPTVYNYYHIGNLRNAVFGDTLRRTLEINKYEVKHVMNITDVGHLVSDADEGEDKLEKGAEREGKTVWEVAEYYTDAFKKDMLAMNILPPNGYHNDKYDDNYARATDFIDQQIEMVQILTDKGFAYQTEQAIYFDVTKLPEYGILSGQRLKDKEVGARSDVVTDSDKKNPHDFVVWFFAVGHFANHTMQWKSPWGSGFPGWHLECSAIIHANLGDPIDIHTGGVDHIGTHHTNEMAQTQAAFGNQLAKFWVHNEFILVDGSKMSKSKNNSYTLNDVEKKGFDALDLRLLYLQTHYSTELNFSWDNLQAAHNRLVALRSFADLRFQSVKTSSDTSVIAQTQSDILEAMSDDMSTPQALSHLSSIENYFNDNLLSPDHIDEFNKLLSKIDKLFGFDLLNTKDITKEQKALLKERDDARTSKDWAKSDKVRDELTKQNISVRDTEHGQIWSRI